MSPTRLLGGRFRLLALAGKGASGEVYRARDELTGEAVAIKCLLGQLADERAEERFAREVRLLATITNPHVVRYVGHGRSEDDRAFVAVEWLEGEDLARRQHQRPLDGPTIIDVVEQAASGLAAIHAIGVVHRDVKPSNLYLTEGSGGRLHVTVIDLGVAFARAEAGLTRQGMMIGTPSYMSPEQIVSRGALTPRSDVFSLGVVLFQLVAGEKPYDGEDILATVAKIALQAPPRLREVFADVPRELDEVVARAMAKNQADRYASVTAFAEALQTVPPFQPLRARSRASEETRLAVSVTAPESVSIASSERRVVTIVVARFARASEAAAASEAFERLTRLRGGVPSALLSLAHAAVFGGAHSTGDEAHRAARAALAFREELAGADVSIATGRARGDGAGLSDDAIERASSLASAPPRAVALDAPTARLLDDVFEIVRMGSNAHLVGERRAEGMRTLAGTVTPCVGRDREIAQLEALYDEVVGEPVARVALLIGAPGAGKSRVRRELLVKLASRSDAPIVLFGRGNALGEGAPFSLVGSAIRGFAGVRDDEPPAAQLAKIAAVVRPSDGPAILGRIARIAGLATDEATDDGVLVSDQLRAAFETWLFGLAQTANVALVLEDVHWADAPSISLVDGALRNLSVRPLFTLAIARPEIEGRFPSLWSSRDPQTFRLAKLTKKSSEVLVRHVLGDDVDTALRDGIVGRADGNAFYLEELIRSVVEARARGQDLAAIALPDTVLGMVQARLDALGVDAKRLCKAASIFGESAWPGGVAQVLGANDLAPGVAEELAALTKEEIFDALPRSRFSGENEYRFRHALLRDAAYELLLEEDRAAAHARAGSWLEAHGERDALVLARHFELGRSPIRAAPHYRKAAEQALHGSDFALALVCAERAIGAGAVGFLAGEAFLIVAEAKRWSGDLAGARVAAERASAELPNGSRHWFSAMRELLAAEGRLGNLDAIAPLAKSLLAVRAHDGTASPQVAALVPAAVHLLYGGDLEGASTLGRAIEGLAERADALDPRARARLHQLRAALATHRDDPEQGIAEQALALEHFDRAGDQRAAALVRSNMSFALLQVGATDRAEALLLAALDVATRLGLQSVKALTLQNLGSALTSQGRLAEAIDAQRRAIALFQAHKDPRLEGSSRVHLALARLANGEPDLASIEANAAIRGGVPTLEVGGRAALARAHLAKGERREALVEATLAVAALDRLGSVEEFEIVARVTLAEVLDANGDRRGALAALGRARDRVLARRDNVRDPAFRASVIAGIPENALVLRLWDAYAASPT